MPFLFHSPKRSIFDQKLCHITVQQRPQGQNVLHEEKDQEKEVFLIGKDKPCKQHPFRVLKEQLKNISIISDEEDNVFFKGKLKKAAVIQSFNDRKKKSSKLKKHVREQLKVVLNGANINNPTGDSLGYGEQINKIGLSKSARKQLLSDNKALAKTLLLKTSDTIQQEGQKLQVNTLSPRPSVRVEQKSSKKNLVYQRQIKSRAESTNQRQFQYCPLNDEVKYFTNGHKFHQTSNFKQVITLSKNQSLKDILFRKETNHVRDGTTITDNGIDLDESLVELIDNYSPCPCKNDMEPIDKLQDKGSCIFLSKVGKFGKSCNGLPGVGAYDLETCKHSVTNQPSSSFASECARKPFQMNLCRQQFKYNPKNTIFDEVKSKINPNCKLFFGSGILRFTAPGQQQIDPFRYQNIDHKIKETNSAISMNFTSQKQSYHFKNDSIGPGDYDQQYSTIEQQCKPKVGIISPKPKSRRIHRKMISNDAQKTILLQAIDMPQDPHKFNNIHNSSNIKLKYTPAEVAFWTNAKCDLKRSLKCIPQLDRYYDVSPQWNKLSYNINYVSQQ